MTNHLAVSAVPSGRRLSLVPSDEPGEQTADEDAAADERVMASSPDEVLALMSDPYSREIIAATAEQPASVADIVTECDMSTATAYRKVNQLVETGLLDEQVQIRPQGTNRSEFVLSIDAIHIVIADGGDPEVTFSLKPRTDQDRLRRVSTDGGLPAGTATDTDGPETQHDNDQQQHLQNLFLDVTGTDKLVEKQDATIQSRYLDEDEDSLVSGYVTSLARDDGLADALPASDQPE